MYCANCGKEISDDFNVCPYCGNNTINATDADTPNPNQQIYHQNPTNNEYGNLKPDYKYNLAAGLFPFFWALVKGMWDLALFCFVMMIIGLIPLVGSVIRLAWFAVSLIIIGRNANYYYRLKKTQKIWMHKAITDPQLRRL